MAVQQVVLKSSESHLVSNSLAEQKLSSHSPRVWALGSNKGTGRAGEEAEGEAEEEEEDSFLLLEQSVTLGGSGEVDLLVAQIGETLQLDAAQDSPASPCAPPGPPAAGRRRLPPPATAPRAPARIPHRRRRPAPAPAAAGALGEPHQGGRAEASFETAAVTRKASPTPALRASVGPSA
ncbi:hypothetical protein PANDA_005195 [Ailuropoda melanoleuca]|uniref:Uncharacterized protein n=1 Tax=Ailuropoda melanoleuca TaxID=9646 RepID=D2H5L3_AILME|nr:hypothetical protein PANDA_005195 [Ailuropoda melanoleuca]